MRGRDSLPSFRHPLPFVFNWLGEISPPKQDGTPQTFCSSEEGKRHPSDKCLTRCLFASSPAFWFYFCTCENMENASHCSQSARSPASVSWWDSVTILGFCKSWLWRALSSLGPFIHSTHQNPYVIMSAYWKVTSASPLWFQHRLLPTKQIWLQF